MWISTQAFHVAKHGCTEAEYEDACFPEGRFCSEVSAYRCAVADGATESAFSGEWAKMLVNGFGRHELRLLEQQRQLERSVASKPLPWYLEAKARRGSHATFAGLSIRETSEPDSASPAGRWNVFAVGDSCVFHVRDGQLLQTGPMSSSQDFGNTPSLLSSRGGIKLQRGAPGFTIQSGSWQAHDVFYLATDAMAQWMMSEHEAGNSPWELLRDQGVEAFQLAVMVLRGTDRLHNDDTTLLRVEMF
jgi:hypothetical protein